MLDCLVLLLTLEPVLLGRELDIYICQTFKHLEEVGHWTKLWGALHSLPVLHVLGLSWQRAGISLWRSCRISSTSFHVSKTLFLSWLLSPLWRKGEPWTANSEVKLATNSGGWEGIKDEKAGNHQMAVDSLKCCLGQSPQMGEVFGKEELISYGLSKEDVILLHSLLHICMVLPSVILQFRAVTRAKSLSWPRYAVLCPYGPLIQPWGAHGGLYVRAILPSCISFCSQSQILAEAPFILTVGLHLVSCFTCFSHLSSWEH